MSDRLKISTDLLLEAARCLDQAQDAMLEVRYMLARVDTSRASGGKLPVRCSFRMPGGRYVGGSDVEEFVYSLKSASNMLGNDIEEISGGIKKSAALFEEIEKEISRSFERIKEASLERSAYFIEGSKGAQPQPTAPFGKLNSFAKISGKHEREDDIGKSNPKHGTNDWYSINCQRCVVAYELRRRGYDVEAKPEYGYNLFIHGALNIVSPFLGMYYHQQKKIYDNWKNYFVDPEWEQLGETNSCQRARENVEAMMVEYGDGARAEVYVAWQGGGAHVFIAENINGEIVFMDPQTGDTDVADYFDDSIMISESVMICRMDDRQLSNYGRQCVKKSSDSHED